MDRFLRDVSKLRKCFTWLFALVIFTLVLVREASAQSDKLQWWYTFNHSNRLLERWGYGVDLNHRNDGVVPFNATLSAARMGINYHTKTGFTVTGGYAWFGTLIDDFDKRWLHENRIYEQVQFSHGNPKWGFNHRIRIEQRFREQITNADTFETDVFLSNRYRYKLQLSGLIKRKPERKTRLRWQVANEILFQNVEQSGSIMFDQNRTLAGVVILPNSKFSLALLYQLIIQQNPNSLDIQEINSLRVTLFHQLDFRDKRKIPSNEVPMAD